MTTETPTAADPKRDAHFGGHSYDATLLRELLAVIYGDGGHYVAKHGIEKACADAQTKWQSAMLPELLKRALEWMAEYETLIFAAREGAWKQMTLIAADIRAACEHNTPAVAPIKAEREAFKAHWKHLDTTEETTYGGVHFVHPHVESLWAGWQARATLAAPVAAALDEIHRWLVCWPIATADDMAQSFAAMEAVARTALQEDCRSCGGTGDGGMGIGCTDCLGTGVV